LGQAYGKTIEKVISQEQGFQLLTESVLLLVTCAKRSPTTLELRHALAVEAGKPKIDDEIDLENTSIIVSVCAGLVIVEGDNIRLVHDTIREYLKTHMLCLIPQEDPTTREEPMKFDAKKNKIAMANAQNTITIICVTYLSFDVFGSGLCQTDGEFEERLRLNPFYDYAVRNWGHHARSSALISCDSVMEFFDKKAQVEASTQALIAIKRYSWLREYSQEFPRQVTGLHLAAYFGVQEAANVLLETGKAGVESKDTDGRTPLSWAAENGHEAVVKLLLDTGKMDVDSEDDVYGRTPLS